MRKFLEQTWLLIQRTLARIGAALVSRCGPPALDKVYVRTTDRAHLLFNIADGRFEERGGSWFYVLEDAFGRQYVFAAADVREVGNPRNRPAVQIIAGAVEGA